MKKYLLSILLLNTFYSFSQVTKYRGLNLVEVEMVKSEEKYSESKKVNVIITVDLDKRKINISEQKDIILDIVKYANFTEPNNSTHFNCLNEKGEPRTVVIENYTKPLKNGLYSQILIKNLIDKVIYIYDVEKVQN